VGRGNDKVQERKRAVDWVLEEVLLGFLCL